MNTQLAGIMIGMILMVVATARAESGIGVGIIVGEPTGISVKKWISNDRAIDAAVAWSFSENASFQFHADYLVHDFGLLNIEGLRGKLPVDFGIGGRIKLQHQGDERGHNNHDALAGVRVPFGISYLFAKAPVDVFAEIVPILDVVPDTRFDIDGAIGARFYFH